MALNNDFRNIPVQSVRRMPLYLQYLKELASGDDHFVSASTIAAGLGMLPIQVRKDLTVTGIKGKPKLGFLRSELIAALELFMGWDNCEPAVLVGAGNLGMAILNFEKFRESGINITGVFDDNTIKIGKKIRNIEIQPVKMLQSFVEKNLVRIGILTVPPSDAQEIAALMTSSGIKAIWNFVPVRLQVPDDIIVENVRLASSLAVLTSKLKKHKNN